MEAIKETNFKFSNQSGVYHGKVRDVYEFGEKLAIVATDRISAFDVVLPKAIPYKGQVLNQIAEKFLNLTKDIVPNWLESTPVPNVSFGKRCKPFPVEMVIRGYLAGHAWREYNAGRRQLCGVTLPEGLKQNDKLPEPIITPTTKAMEGHDEDISREEIISKGLVKEELYVQLENYTRNLFKAGTEFAASQGLILVDTKYEFGMYGSDIFLIDEVHTPDSSRYFYLDTYHDLQAQEQPQRQLSKEFVRQWLIENGFQGKEGQTVPEMSEDFVSLVSNRYVELFEKITGSSFEQDNYEGKLERIKVSIETLTQ